MASWSKYDKDDVEQPPWKEDVNDFPSQPTDSADFQTLSDNTTEYQDNYDGNRLQRSNIDNQLDTRKKDLSHLYPKTEDGKEAFPIDDPFVTSPAFIKKIASRIQAYKPTKQEVETVQKIRRTMMWFPLIGLTLGVIGGQRLSTVRNYQGGRRFGTVSVLGFWGMWTGGLFGMMFAKNIAQRELADSGLARILRDEIAHAHMEKYGSLPPAWEDSRK